MMRLSGGAARVWLIVALILASLPIAANVSGADASGIPALHYLYGSGSTTGGGSIELKVELSGPAPSSGTKVSLSQTGSKLSLPNAVVVPASQSSATIRVESKPVA